MAKLFAETGGSDERLQCCVCHMCNCLLYKWTV